MTVQRTALFGALAGALLAAPLHAQTEIKIGYALAAAPDSHYGVGAQRWQEVVEERTDGRYVFRHFPSSGLGGEREVIEGVQLGTVEATIVSSGTLANFVEEAGVFDIPFLFRDLGHARRVLDATDALIAAADQKALIDGTLRLGVTEMIVHTWLRDYLRRLKETYPNLSVELTVDLSVNLEAMLAESRIDLAIQNGPFTRLMTGEIDLGAYGLIWVASPDLGVPQKAMLDDLAAHPILTHARDTHLFAQVAGHFSAAKVPARLVPSSNLAACLHMTIEGMGVATLPKAMAADALARGDLVQVGYDWTPPPLHFFARYNVAHAPRVVNDAAFVAARAAQAFDQEF